MRYKRFLEEIDYLAFIEDEADADAAVKAVVEMLAAMLSEPTARAVLERLPGPFSYDRPGPERLAPPASLDDAYDDLAERFGLESDEAEELVDTILRTAMESLDRETVARMESELPKDWRELVESAWEDYEAL